MFFGLIVSSGVHSRKFSMLTSYRAAEGENIAMAGSGPLPRWRSPESAAGCWGTAGATLSFGCKSDFINRSAARRLRALASGVEASSSMAVAKLGGRK
jgi:hypothetical protein